MSEQQDRERFLAVLPLYSTNRLDQSTRDWVEQYLREHPEAAGELRLEESLRNVLRNDLPRFSATDGLPKFMARVRAENISQEHGSPLRRAWHGILAGWLSPPPRPAWAMTLALVVAQTTLISWLMVNPNGSVHPAGTGTYAEWRSVGTEPSVAGAVLQINFKPDARETDIRLLLINLEGEIVGGPGQFGHYIVRVPTETIERAMAEAGANNAVESAAILQEAPRQE